MRSIYAGTAALVGWLALALELWIFLKSAGDLTTADRLVNYFSYFTILSNIAAAIVLTLAATGARTRLAGFFGRPTVQTGVAAYMTMTAIGYVLLMQTGTPPEGWAFVADALLHYVTPLFTLGFWFLFVPRGTLRLGDLVGFLGFPVIYLAYAMLRGSIVHRYPYAILDVGRLGIETVAVNIAEAAGVLALVCLVFIALDHGLRPRGHIALT